MPARAPRRSFLRETPWRWTDVLIGFAPLLLFDVVTLLIDPRSSLATALRRFWIPLTLLGQVWMLVVPLWIARRRTNVSARIPRVRAVLIEALFALLGLPVLFASATVVFLIVANLSSGSESPGMPWAPLAGSFAGIEWLAFVIMAIGLSPVAEEMLYRGLFYNALRQRLHPILAAAVQAAVFGYEHPFGLAQSAGIGMAGLVLALVYEWRKTILAPILLHAAMNTMGIGLLALSLAADAAAPRLGVLGEAGQGGCVVKRVLPGSAAGTAGIEVGDVITLVDGEPVADVPSLARVVRKHQLGDVVSIEFRRGGKVHRADVVLVRLRE